LCFRSALPCWSRVFETTTPCEEREPVACTAATEQDAQRFADDAIDQVLWSCLGNENSLTVQLVNGCATYYRSSARSPEMAACVEEALEHRRFPCADDVSCASASHSTLP
jgi:hypothetical protein